MNRCSVYIVLSLFVYIRGAFAAINAASDTTCGRSVVRRARIKGGNDASEGEFPWLVSIRFGTGFDSVHLCGGSLLHNRFVVTAAHCMQNKITKYMNIMAGEYDVRGRSNHEQIRSIKKVIIHEKFSKGYLNDIAIIELSDPVSWSPFVRPICLPDANVNEIQNLASKQVMTVAGWGYTDENSKGGEKPRILQKANVPVVELKTCQKYFNKETKVGPGDPRHLLLIGENHICAGYDNGKKDSCNGDSGGPLMKVDGKGREVIIGIVSSGIGCGRPQVPGIYTKLVTYVPWVKRVLAENGVTFAS